MANYLTGSQIKRIQTTMGDYGYKDMRSAIDIISGWGYYSRDSVGPLLRNIFSRKRPMPDKMAEYLLELCKNDKRIQFLKTPDYPRRYNRNRLVPADLMSAEYPYPQIAAYYARRIIEKMDKVPDKEKTKTIKRLEKIVEELELKQTR